MINPILRKKVITDRIFFSWIRCKRKAWLDQNENNCKKAWSPHRALQLDHQHKSFQAFNAKKPGQGIEGCKKGASGIVGLRLKGFCPSGQRIEAHPLFLQKIKGKSCWGNFSYIPVTVRQGRRITREHRLSLALWGYLLGQLQQTEVKYGLIISKSDERIEIQKVILNNKIKNELLKSLNKLAKDIYKNDLPPLTIDRKKCTICSWKYFCDFKAYQQGDLSEINGIGAKRKDILQQIGIKDINQLASFNPDDLINKLSIYGTSHQKIAKQLIMQAKSQRDSLPQKISQDMVLPELKACKGVIIYDIESDPDLRLDFLHGFVILKREENGSFCLENAEYKSILNLSKKNEKKTWEQIKIILKGFSSYPVLHYGETELISICQLAKRQGLEEKDLFMFKPKFIDIHARLKKGWILPIQNYSLKSVATWLDFKWSREGANGAKALLWWRQLKKASSNKDQRSNQIKWILEYNQDDCIATWKIADWIINQN